MKLFRLVAKNAVRNRRRAVLTVLSVALCVFLVAVLVAVLAGFDRGGRFGEGHLRLVVRNAVSLQIPLPERLRGELEAQPHVNLVYSHSWFGGIYKDDRPENFFAQFACDAPLLRKMFDELNVPDDEFDGFVRNRQGFVASRELAKRYGWTKGSRITLKGTFWPCNPELVLEGFFDSPEFDQAIFFHRDYMEELLGRPGPVSVFWLKVDSAENMAAVAEAVDGKYRNSPHETHTETEQAFRTSFIQMMGNVEALIRNLGLAVLFTIVLIAANTMAMSARERGREIAVMRCLGFSRPKIVALVVGESLLLCLVGGVVGLSLALLFLHRVAAHARGFLFFLRQAELSPAALAGSVLLAVGVGLVAGFLPALRAARIRPVDGLRRVA